MCYDAEFNPNAPMLTHVAERLRILPGMGWGLPDSPGHYLDLVCAIRRDRSVADVLGSGEAQGSPAALTPA
jgi:hypothetical protein